MKVAGALRDPLRQFVTDKEYVKYYVAGSVGTDVIPETYDVLKSDHDVEEYVLSRVPCIIKPTHMSGEAIIVYTKGASFDRSILKAWLRNGYFRVSREDNYRHLQPKVIIEEFFTSDPPNPPNDYKIFCWHGEPQLIIVGNVDRPTRNIYDPLWNRVPIVIGSFPAGDSDDERPTNLNRMLDIARILSSPFSFIRVDLYSDGQRIRVGELTNCPNGGVLNLRPDHVDYCLGSMFETGGHMKKLDMKG